MPQDRTIARVRAALRRENARRGVRLKRIDHLPVGPEPAPLEVWRSRRFLVQVYAAPGGVERLSVNRTDMDADGGWVEGITWDELQRLKGECGRGDREAVEVYPPDGRIIDDANMRHLWVLPERMPFSWRQGRRDDE